jgi:hypothetical protein
MGQRLREVDKLDIHLISHRKEKSQPTDPQANLRKDHSHAFNWTLHC